MADVFISYQRQRRPTAQHLAKILEAHGFTVWFDQSLEPGEEFGPRIVDQLSGAKAVIVLWCGRSVASEWVIREADLAKVLGRYVPMRIEVCQLPDKLRSDDIIDVSNWNGDPSTRSLDRLIKRLEKLTQRVAAIELHQTVAMHETWKQHGSPSLAQLVDAEPQPAAASTRRRLPTWLLASCAAGVFVVAGSAYVYIRNSPDTTRVNREMPRASRPEILSVEGDSKPQVMASAEDASRKAAAAEADRRAEAARKAVQESQAMTAAAARKAEDDRRRELDRKAAEERSAEEMRVATAAAARKSEEAAQKAVEEQAATARRQADDAVRMQQAELDRKAEEARKAEAVRLATAAAAARKAEEAAQLAEQRRMEDERQAAVALRAAEEKVLVRKIQSELRRVGCYTGGGDGVWGPQTIGALEDFAKVAKVADDSSQPSKAILGTLEKSRLSACGREERTVEKPVASPVRKPKPSGDTGTRTSTQ